MCTAVSCKYQCEFAAFKYYYFAFIIFVFQSLDNSLQIIDPWGKILAECPKYRSDVPVNNSVAIAEIDLSLVSKVRTEMPVYEHRRNDIYTLTQLNPSTQKITRETFNFADKIIPGSTVFYESSFSFAFTNIRCVVPGRILFLLSTSINYFIACAFS